MEKHKIVYRSPDELVPYERNAKRHDAANVEKIARVIGEFGFRDPVLITADKVIVWGHGRVLAAKRLKLAEIPTISLPADTPLEKVNALRIAHNKIAEDSVWDSDILAEELRKLREADFDLSYTAFSDNELERMLGDLDELVEQHTKPAPNRLAPVPEIPDDEPSAPANGAASQSDDQPPYEYPDADDERPAPKASDDDYSEFKLVMLHANKIRLLDTLNRVRADHALDKLEDALMHVVAKFTSNED